MAKDYSQAPRKVSAEKEHKFYKHLKTYLWFIAVMCFLRFSMHENIHFQPIAFWWGFIIVLQYIGTFGWEGVQNLSGWEESCRRKDRAEELEEDTFVELKPREKVKAWREQDLV